MEAGWTRPSDWWAPEVDAVVEAITGERDPLAACARLGHARADAGAGVRETLNDLCALYGQLPEREPPLVMVRALVEAWAEAAVAVIQVTTCEDPLSGLASAAYLRTRLAEVYREAERDGSAASDRHVLLVVDLDAVKPAAGWEELLQQLVLGECLRSVFSGGETLAAVSNRTVIGLIGRELGMARRVESLRGRFADVAGLADARVWIEPLPAALITAYDVVACLDGSP
jgi:hypothetical protein